MSSRPRRDPSDWANKRKEAMERAREMRENRLGGNDEVVSHKPEINKRPSYLDKEKPIPTSYTDDDPSNIDALPVGRKNKQHIPEYPDEDEPSNSHRESERSHSRGRNQRTSESSRPSRRQQLGYGDRAASPQASNNLPAHGRSKSTASNKRDIDLDLNVINSKATAGGPKSPGWSQMKSPGRVPLKSPGRVLPRSPISTRPVDSSSSGPDSSRGGGSGRPPKDSNAPSNGPPVNVRSRLSLLKSKMRGGGRTEESSDDGGHMRSQSAVLSLVRSDKNEIIKEASYQPKTAPQPDSRQHQAEHTRQPRRAVVAAAARDVSPPPNESPRSSANNGRKHNSVITNNAEYPSDNDDDGNDESNELNECPDCGRKFNDIAFPKHTRVCKKVFGEKRKAFDVRKQRLEGEALQLLKKKEKEEKKKGKGGTAAKSAEETPLGGGGGAAPKWKNQSEALREAMKAVRETQKAIDKGLPPPPVKASALDPGMIQCDNCGRRFNERAAERHIPLCKDIKAKPTALRKGAGNAGGLIGGTLNAGNPTTAAKAVGVSTKAVRSRR